MERRDIRELLVYALLGLAICKWLHWKWASRHFQHFFGNFKGPTRICNIWTLRIMNYRNYALKFITAIYEEFQDKTISGWLGPVPTLITTDPALVEKIMLSPDLQNKSTLYDPIKRLARGGLVFISDKAWYHHRKLLNPCFHNSLLLKFIDKFNVAKNVAIAELNALADGRDQKLDDLMIYLTMRTSLDTSFDVHLPKEQLYSISKSLAHLIKEFIWKAVLAFLHLEFLTIFDRKMEQTRQYLKVSMEKIVEKKLIANLENESSQIDDQTDEYDSIRKSPKILLNQCIELYKIREFTFDDIVIECLMVLGASFDTTGITMYSVLVMLAMHPDIQARVFEEVLSVCPDKDSQVENEHLRQLTYLDMVIKETMRLIPPIVHIGRDVRKDTPISKDLVLPKGLQILIPIFHLHRLKDVWGPDADDFNPDRFLPENYATIHPYAYIPFSKGARNCVGWRYAEIMMKIVLAGLIRNFKYETDLKYEDLEFESGIAIGYKVPPLLRIQQRP